MIFKYKTIANFFIILSTVCCSPSIYKPTEADVFAGKKQYPDLTMEQLNKGLALYGDKCGSCHALYKPKEITEKRWAETLPEMKEKARLTDKEYVLITQYLMSKNVNPN